MSEATRGQTFICPVIGLDPIATICDVCGHEYHGPADVVVRLATECCGEADARRIG